MLTAHAEGAKAAVVEVYGEEVSYLFRPYTAKVNFVGGLCRRSDGLMIWCGQCLRLRHACACGVAQSWALSSTATAQRHLRPPPLTAACVPLQSRLMLIQKLRAHLIGSCTPAERADFAVIPESAKQDMKDNVIGW